MTADSHESRELQNLEYLKSQTRENLSSHFVIQLLDSFCHEGPNGAHQCLVFELLGPSVDKVLADYQQVGDQLCPETIGRVSRQLLEAVRLLHSVGVSHGGANTLQVTLFH
jgi:serine/threonine protein kinase